MTDAASPEPITDDSTPEDAAPEAPPPEPWTAAKVGEWNAYYDIYVAVGVLLLTFLASANKIITSSIWTHLQAGREVAARFSPTSDPFSFSQPGATWVHVPWLSDLGHYEIYQLVAGFAPTDPQSQGNPNNPAVIQARREQEARAEQWGAAGLIAVDAFLRAMTVLVLLRVRHRGPGLWWSAICATIALAAMPLPNMIINGGLAGPTIVGSITWSQLLLALELLCLFRAFGRGKVRSLYALIPLFLVWANVDESFLFGLLALAAAVVGSSFGPKAKPRPDKPAAPSSRTGLIVLGASAAVCLINPSFFRVYPAALATITPWLGLHSGPATEEQSSLFANVSGPAAAGMDVLRIYFFALAAIGYASFLLNRRRFSLPRFLVYTVAVLAWASVRRYAIEFAEVFAVVLALNGQEWYHSAFGTEGRLGRGWATWSIGGRAATIALVFVAILRVATGSGLQEGEPSFGFGFDPDDFAFEAADFVRDAPIEGNVLNTTLKQGDSIVWRAYPKRKSFFDSRRHLFGSETLRKFDEARKAIRDGDVEKWKPILDEYKVSSYMIDVDPTSTSASPRTYFKLTASPEWIPIYDDGENAVFGRADAPEPDLSYFRSHRLDADTLVYKEPTPLPSSDKLPTATSALDMIYRFRSRARPQSHTLVARRWLRPTDLDPTTPFLPDPARCLMVVREARIALYAKPEDTSAYGALADAYRALLVQESAMIAGIPIAPENINAINNTSPQLGLLASRFRQYITALNYAILTTPPKEVLSPEEKGRLAQLNQQLANVFLAQGFLDLARDRLREVIDLSDPEAVPPDVFARLSKQINDMDNQIGEVQNRITTLGIESQAGPLQKAAEARRLGAVGLAIQQLEEGLQAGLNPGAIKASLLDLYCQVGQPEKALDLWVGGNSADPVLGDGPGTAALRQGKVFFLVGNYSSALTLWSREAIPNLKAQRALRAPQATRALIDGDPMATARTFLELPEEVQKQSLWEFDLGLACLEAGQPVDETVTHLTNALNLVPDLAVRPVIAYYLQKLGKPVPADPNAAPKPAASPAVGAPLTTPALVAPPTPATPK